MGIGEGRVGFPNAFGQTAKGFLRLNAVVLPDIARILEKSIMLLLLHQFDDVAEVATQHSADLRQDLCADMLVLAQLGKGGRRHAGSQTQIAFFSCFYRSGSFHNLL